jgi:hypothetical protein
VGIQKIERDFQPALKATVNVTGKPRVNSAEVSTSNIINEHYQYHAYKSDESSNK